MEIEARERERDVEGVHTRAEDDSAAVVDVGARDKPEVAAVRAPEEVVEYADDTRAYDRDVCDCAELDGF